MMLGQPIIHAGGKKLYPYLTTYFTEKLNFYLKAKKGKGKL